ncbi:hypothetical protein E1B28_012292 [Marasmius oreades]|uniref:Telomere-associated protein Rif1 N-terminal domain-containing protein n=1 Tax=Marasmius oreades TaxID=181124 RepID=A0A9P7UQM1_9AGAR|nr:uncharacterized protein E1B28_012292 [Marasmius oreades]KAG7088279.1 hypothetical protein E1B28_012292 [Marasmius oreades]
MSLPTPPKSSHREEKENRTQASGCRVVWSQHNQYHSLSAPPRGPTFCSATKEPPAKSILKKSSFPLLPLENECEQREFTPEPSNPLGDPTYLNTPIITIISDSDHKLSELIQAYSVLAARLRAYVHERTDGSCTIFTPLKKSREFVLKSILRDLGRALVNPVVSEERDSARVVTLLPSPTNSPKKKRGMTAEQAKLARDLCTLSHSVLKLIGLVFTLRVVYQVFSDAELGQILTAVLAIPLADALPTPNARKTCALAICVIQTQRLPSSVLLGAKDRIAYALRRGIDGELGKEGKRGSASDGLKAVHDLAIYQPETFIPAFSQLIDSVLNNLLGPSLALRINACHALGGLAIASAETPLSQNHVRIASAIASFLLNIPTKTSPTKSTPSSKSNLAESPICRTLRTTLNNESPSHVAQGPVWALSVLASFSVLLGSSLFKDSRLSRAITSLLSIPLRHKKSSIRCLACIVWRSLTWAHFQPAYSDPDGESEVEGEDHKSQNQSCHTAANNWKILQAVLTMGTGTSILAACVGSGPETDDEGLRRVIQLLELMIRKNPDTLKDAMQVIIQLLSLSPSKRQWDMNNLLPRSLFSGVPGLLTTDFSQLQPIVRQAYDACTSADDVRPLTCDELSRHGILDEFFHLWQRAAYLHDVFEKDLDLVKEGWIALLNAAMAIYEDGTEESSEVVAQKVAHTIQQLLSGDITYGSPNSSVELPTSKFDPQSAFARMLKLLQELWSIARNTLPCDNLDRHADSLLRCLVKYEEEMNVDEKSSRGEWAAFCVELSLACGGVDAFWNDTAATKWDWSVEIRSRVWSIFVRRVQADRRGAWDDALLLLSLPFRDPNAWDLSGEDLDTWEGLLRFGLEKARDIGFDDLTALNEVAENLHQPTFSSCGRIAEMLLTRCQLSEGDAFPSVLVEFITDTLRSRYPPKPSEVTSSLWIMRPLREMIETCPKSLTQSLLEILQEGISLWVSDEYEVMAELDYGEVVNLYESSLRSIPESLEAYEALAPLLEAVFLGRPDKPSALEAFENFWNDSSYSSIVDSNDWPAKIQEHFGAATQEVPEALDLPPSSPPSSDDGLEAESTPNIDILSLLPAPVILSTPPKHTRTSSTAPPCLNQTPTYYSPVFTPTPSIPSTYATPRDAMALVRSPLLISPRVKRRRTENKENESPNVLLGHTRPVFASPPQKRRLSKENDDDRPLKRVRIDTATLSSIPKLKLSVEPTKACDDEEAVEEMLIPRDSISPRKDVFGVPLQRTNSRKRKAIMLDAVEIFTFQEFERRRTSPRKPVKASSQTALPRTPRTPQRKAIDMSSSPTIPDVLDLNSDDSIMLGRSSPVKDPKQSSSDDDPHLGQVTPHHLISPILKRAKRSYDEDPPSDDSITLGSPSKAVVLRRMQRLGSATGRIA